DITYKEDKELITISGETEGAKKSILNILLSEQTNKGKMDVQQNNDGFITLTITKDQKPKKNESKHFDTQTEDDQEENKITPTSKTIEVNSESSGTEFESTNRSQNKFNFKPQNNSKKSFLPVLTSQSPSESDIENTKNN
ncbi:MAG: hypothetical protein ACK5XN_22215, partial [Bacteroidota bacterium]